MPISDGEKIVCSIYAVAEGWYWGLLYQWRGWMYSMMFTSSSVAVRTPTIPVFQPQTILQVLVEEYFTNNFTVEVNDRSSG